MQKISEINWLFKEKRKIEPKKIKERPKTNFFSLAKIEFLKEFYFKFRFYRLIGNL